MDFAGLDLNLLVALDALIVEKNVSRAGDRLHLSQSATSGALARLRKAFHDPLLVQIGRKMALTPLAEGLAEPVRDFLLQAEAILNNNPAFDPGASTRVFRLMMSDYVETVLMTEALARIEKLAPRVTVELISNVEGGTGELDRGEIDLAITPTKYLSPEHPSERLFEDDFTCVVWAGNPQVGRKISLETYLSLGHVIVRFGRQQQIPTFDQCFMERFGHERRIEVVTTAFNLVPQLLIGSCRIATLHRRLAQFYERYLPLRLVALPVPIPRFEESMQWHKSRDRDPAIVWLRGVLKSAVKGNRAATSAGARPAEKQAGGLPHRAKTRTSPRTAGFSDRRNS